MKHNAAHPSGPGLFLPPNTHFVSSSKDIHAIVSSSLAGNGPQWVVKDSHSRISIVSDASAYSVSKGRHKDRSIILQEYIHDGMVVDGYRTDIECRVCIVSVEPLKVVMVKQRGMRSNTVYEKGNVDKYMIDTSSVSIDIRVLEETMKKYGMSIDWPKVRSGVGRLVEAWREQGEYKYTRGTFCMLDVRIMPCLERGEYYMYSVKRSADGGVGIERSVMGSIIDRVLHHHTDSKYVSHDVCTHSDLSDII